MSIGTSVIPNLVISQRVIDKMASAARRYIQDETGEAMVGLLVPGTNTNGVPTLYVLDTISPDESAIRRAHTFQQGDDRQDEIIWWLRSNWQTYRELRRASYGSALQAKWDTPLRYLGDWHKQPGYMIAPSGGDLMTALDWMDDRDNNMDFLLAPIVTLGHPATTIQPTSNTNFVTVPHSDGSNTRIDFWYIDREGQRFAPVAPTIYPADQLPGLPEYPWHLTDTNKFEDEYGRLENDGLFLSLVLHNAIEGPPLEVCLMALRMNAPKVLLLITPWNYPQQAPSARVAPYTQFDADANFYDVFKDFWEQSEPVDDPPDWSWSSDKYLIDYVHALEVTLGLREETPVTEAETAAVSTDDVDGDNALDAVIDDTQDALAQAEDISNEKTEVLTKDRIDQAVEEFVRSQAETDANPDDVDESVDEESSS